MKTGSRTVNDLGKTSDKRVYYR